MGEPACAIAEEFNEFCGVVSCSWGNVSFSDEGDNSNPTSG